MLSLTDKVWNRNRLLTNGTLSSVLVVPDWSTTLQMEKCQLYAALSLTTTSESRDCLLICEVLKTFKFWIFTNTSTNRYFSLNGLPVPQCLPFSNVLHWRDSWNHLPVSRRPCIKLNLRWLFSSNWEHLATLSSAEPRLRNPALDRQPANKC